MKKYNPSSIEKKWQKYWETNKIFKTPTDVTKENKMYILPQLPYPSGFGLHVGHAEVYTACDIYARYERMRGKKVLQVIGWDAFGLPAENYAIKTNVHPRKSTDKAIDNFRKQIKALGISVDWDREVGSHNPDYYKWTQWFFLLFYKRGLAYRKKQAVNWCDSCKTVLANEQVTSDGKCERCETVVVQREMEQWYLKITEYADRLLKDLDKIDWPEETKKRQRDWIGRSEGAEVKFKIKDSDKEITVFTTRPDTLFGSTFMVLAPESVYTAELINKVLNRSEVEKYIGEAKLKTDLDRQIQKEKSGVELKGVKVINPVNGAELPIYIADYVLGGYGTGAIMAVPAHDERDFEFAKKYGLKIVEVLKGGDILKEAFVGDGELVNSDFLNGLQIKSATEKIISWLEEKGVGKRKIQYKLRDWSVSRQRFWGAPIPMLHNDELINKKYHYVILHGYTGTGDRNGPAAGDSYNWRRWLKNKLVQDGHTVFCPDLPNTTEPNIEEQVEYILKNTEINEETILIGHSLGGVVIYKLLEKLNKKVTKVFLVDPVVRPEFPDRARPAVAKSCDWNFDFNKIKNFSKEFVVLGDAEFKTIFEKDLRYLAQQLNGNLVLTKPAERHFTSAQEPIIVDLLEQAGWMPVSESDLPVILPNDVDFKPTGESPLNYSKSFNKGVEKKYGKGWKREPDTLDTFMCSSWYYFRYLDPKNDLEFASPEALKKWMPVDFYLGGPEHVNGHLLYSRFFTKVLFDAGYIDFDEPFIKHRHQGLILGEDSRKMSKRWGNVINPSDVADEYGADTMRMYEMFMGPLEQDKPWDTNGVKGVRRFIERVWNYGVEVVADKNTNDDSLSIDLHKTVKKITEDLESMKFNTAIAALMILINKMYVKKDGEGKALFSVSDFEIFVKLISPFTPHIAEELWNMLGHKESIVFEKWPEFDPAKIQDKTFTLAIQVNGKLRDTVEVPADISEAEVRQKALASEKIQKWLEGKEPKKIIFVKGKLVSLVI
ncbi:MAG: leucine--tRNA ligase [Candidatus Magasanikbacteria bacterium]